MRNTFPRIGIIVSAAAATVAMMLSGCSVVTTGSEAPQTTAATHSVKKILFDFPFTALPVYRAVSQAAQAEADKQGVKLEFTNDNTDLTAQVNNLTTYANSGVDAVVSFPMDSMSLDGLRKQYQQNGKYWITYASNMPGEDASLQFSFKKSGLTLSEDAGAWITKQLGGKAKVVVLEETTTQIGKDRTVGIQEGLKKYAPNAEVVATQQAITPDQGLSVMNSVLAQHPDVNVVLSAVGDAAQGAYQALVASGRAANDPNTYVGGLDGNLSLLKALKDGDFVRALVSVKPDEIGKAVVDLPVKLGNGDVSVKNFDVPVYLITAKSPDLNAWLSTFGG